MVDDGGKAGVLAVVAAIGIVAGYLGELQLIDRKIEHRELKMRLLIGLPVNGSLERSLFGRADERRGEVNEKRAGRHDAGADRGQKGAVDAAGKADGNASVCQKQLLELCEFVLKLLCRCGGV
ncbi:MAG: hypothetical protein ACLU7D_08115 [Collinsella sp.]